jgi:hypothetical protein
VSELDVHVNVSAEVYPVRLVYVLAVALTVTS